MAVRIRCVQFGLVLVTWVISTNRTVADGVDLLVIGWPAIGLGRAPPGQVARGLVGLTVLGQVADRVGAICAGLIVEPVVRLLGLVGEAAWAAPLLIMNFLFSGIAVGILALYFLRRRWRLSSRLGWGIATAAAVLTNPAWVIGTWFLFD